MKGGLQEEVDSKNRSINFDVSLTPQVHIVQTDFSNVIPASTANIDATVGILRGRYCRHIY
jgi:hypothetical protein